MSSDPPVLQWTLQERMARTGIRSVAELQRRLAKRGVSLSCVQLARIVRALPEKLSTKLLRALCDELRCEPGDLLRVPAAVVRQPVAPAAPQAPEAPNTLDSKRRSAGAPLTDAERERAVGPRVRSLPSHPLTKAAK